MARMNHVHIVLFVFFMLVSGIAFGHSDFFLSKDFGNVKVRIKTGFQYEEIRKSWIIGELARRLCEKLNYGKQVFIDFNHYYVGDCDPDYFLSFDDGSIIEGSSSEKSKPVLKERSLVIREVSRRLSPAVTLRLLEYAVRNTDKIKSSQRSIEYKQNYCYWRVNTIDTTLLKNVAGSVSSNVVTAVLLTKVSRELDQDEKMNISYFYQNEKYHIFYNDFVNKDSVLLVVDNVCQFNSISFEKVVVFDSDSSFYFVQGINNPHRSQRMVIDMMPGNFYPFEIVGVGSKMVFISFWELKKERERTLLFRSDTEELIQDLDSSLH